MILRIKNLGVIKEASIGLNKGLTMFCGPNGTGKTYAAYVINAVCNSWSGDVPASFLKNCAEGLKTRSCSITRQHLEEWAHAVEQKVTRELPMIFGVSNSEGKSLFKGSEITLEVEDADLDKVITSHFKTTLYRGSHRLLRMEKGAENASFSFVPDEAFDGVDESVQCGYLAMLYALVFRSALLSKYESRMLTVERNSIYTFKTELLQNRLEAVDQVLMAGDSGEEIVRSRSSLYPLAVRNSLSVASDLENIIKNEGEFSRFAMQIESEILGGTVAIGKEGDVQFTPKASDAGEEPTLPIKMASSSVKTMSGLVIYLKHLAHKGDFLIIDEPEMNLHPDNQRRLARIFARMVNQGIRLAVSTHSDYIIRELNNLVMASALAAKGDDSFRKLGYDESEPIKAAEMQAYLFDFTEGGQVVATPIEIDDYGMAVTTIDAAIDAQNEATLILRDTLDEL